MPKGDKSSYSAKQKRQAEHIEQGYEKRGSSENEAVRRAWGTVNKSSGGGSQTEKITRVAGLLPPHFSYTGVRCSPDPAKQRTFRGPRNSSLESVNWLFFQQAAAFCLRPHRMSFGSFIKEVVVPPVAYRPVYGPPPPTLRLLPAWQHAFESQHLMSGFGPRSEPTL